LILNKNPHFWMNTTEERAAPAAAEFLSVEKENQF